MKFSCEKVLLQSAINTASRAVASKSSIPALEGILLQAGAQLTISGYNMNTGIRTTLEASITEEGELVLPARLFGDIIRHTRRHRSIRIRPQHERKGHLR